MDENAAGDGNDQNVRPTPMPVREVDLEDRFRDPEALRLRRTQRCHVVTLDILQIMRWFLPAARGLARLQSR